MERINSIDSSTLNLLKEHNLLNSLIKAELIKEIHDNSLISLDEIKNEISLLKKSAGVNNDEAFEEWLKNRNLNIEKLKTEIKQKKTIKLFCKDKFEHKVESRFIDKKDSLDIVIYNLIRVKDPSKALELYLRVSENEEDFNSVAEKFSEGQEKLTRGLVGPIELSKAHINLASLLKTTTAGFINQPIQVEGWNLIVKLENYIPAKLDQSMKDRLSLQFFEEWLEDEASNKIKSLT
tara:strand:- start:19 stop:726 length:708 start_codon:yes stop_codon:yes gene_type:complete